MKKVCLAIAAKHESEIHDGIPFAFPEVTSGFVVEPLILSLEKTGPEIYNKLYEDALNMHANIIVFCTSDVKVPEFFARHMAEMIYGIPAEVVGPITNKTAHMYQAQQVNQFVAKIDLTKDTVHQINRLLASNAPVKTKVVDPFCVGFYMEFLRRNELRENKPFNLNTFDPLSEVQVRGKARVYILPSCYIFRY